MANSTREGFLYGLVAYGWWGLVPIYFRWLKEISLLDILAHRILWSAVLLGMIATLTRRWPEILGCWRTPQKLGPLILSALLVAFNWLLYIFAVAHEMLVQASLGYFILPLISILMALVIFRERLRPLQRVAIGFAGMGVVGLSWDAGAFPWLALALAVSFSLYGMIRKQVPVDGLVGLTIETLVLLPIALAYLMVQEGLTLAGAPGGAAGAADAGTLAKLSLSGVVTAVPLLCFGKAARLLPFSTLGFMQYISPSVQFLLAVYLFQEEVHGGRYYVLIWIALGIFSLDSYRWYRKQAVLAEVAVGSS